MWAKLADKVALSKKIDMKNVDHIGTLLDFLELQWKYDICSPTPHKARL